MFFFYPLSICNHYSTSLQLSEKNNDKYHTNVYNGGGTTATISIATLHIIL